MKITVLLFGHYRDLAPAGVFEMEIAPGTTIRDAAARLAEDNPRLSDLLMRTRVAVGAEFATADTVLCPGDELAFLPPMSGG